MIYYKKSSDDGSERHDHFRLKNFVDEGWAQQEMIPNGNFMKPYFKVSISLHKYSFCFR